MVDYSKVFVCTGRGRGFNNHVRLVHADCKYNALVKFKDYIALADNLDASHEIVIESCETLSVELLAALT